MSEINVTDENFEQEVLKADKTVLVDFWASWCGPCRMLAPVVAEIAEEHPEIKVCKVNVDEAMDLAQTYRVVSIPMLAVFKNGELVKKSVGAQPKSAILEWVQGE